MVLRNNFPSVGGNKRVVEFSRCYSDSLFLKCYKLAGWFLIFVSKMNIGRTWNLNFINPLLLVFPSFHGCKSVQTKDAALKLCLSIKQDLSLVYEECKRFLGNRVV